MVVLMVILNLRLYRSLGHILKSVSNLGQIYMTP